MKSLNIAYQSVPDIKTFQENKLQEVLKYLQEKSSYYQQVFKTNAIDIQSIKKLEDLTKIPVTTKDDLQQHNDDFLCVPKTKVIDIVTTSGTLGEPVNFYLTDKDLDRLAYNEATSYACAGVMPDDTIQLMTTIDRRFMAGLAYFLGARKLGASIVRVGSGVPEMQWDSILKFKPTYLVCVPSFLLKLITYAEKHDICLEKTSVNGVICIGETIRNQDFSLNTLGKKIADKWKIQLYSTYASTEMSTAFTECEYGKGGHLTPELIITEILDEYNTPVRNNEAGELCITTLRVEGMPLLRFKTGDIVKRHPEKCSCGRNSLRLGPVVGRKKQMIKYKGTTLYPPAMHNILNDFESIKSYVIELFRNDLGTDEIQLKIATEDDSEDFLNEIKDHFRAKLRVTPSISFLSYKEIQKLKFPEMSRKPVTIIDKRL